MTPSRLTAFPRARSVTTIWSTRRRRVNAISSCYCRRLTSRLTISPHTIRHTTALHLLQSGVDISVIALHSSKIPNTQVDDAVPPYPVSTPPWLGGRIPYTS
ncbi:tyrosine-type recombinase/integrase [Pararhizobium sp. LjRoot238]